MLLAVLFYGSAGPVRDASPTILTHTQGLRIAVATNATKFVAHQHLALVLCDDPAILEEVLRELDTSGLDIRRVGARALALPVEHLAPLRERLWEQGSYPRVVGAVPATTEPEEEAEEEEGQ